MYTSRLGEIPTEQVVQKGLVSWKRRVWRLSTMVSAAILKAAATGLYFQKQCVVSTTTMQAPLPSGIFWLQVPDSALIERVVGRRLDPVSGEIFHMKFKPPPKEIESRLIQRSDDTEEKVN